MRLTVVFSVVVVAVRVYHILVALNLVLKRIFELAHFTIYVSIARDPAARRTGELLGLVFRVR